MSVNGFLQDSPLADRIKLPTRVVVNRGELSPADVAAIKAAGEYTPDNEGVCELEVGGMILARGRVIKRRGHTYFKVTAMGDQS